MCQWSCCHTGVTVVMLSGLCVGGHAGVSVVMLSCWCVSGHVVRMVCQWSCCQAGEQTVRGSVADI